MRSRLPNPASRSAAASGPVPAVLTRRITRSSTLARFAYQEPVPDIEDAAGTAARKRRRVLKQEDNTAAGSTTNGRSTKAEAKVEEKKVKVEVKAEVGEESVKMTRSASSSTVVKTEEPAAMIKQEPPQPNVKTEPDAATPPTNTRKRRQPARVIRGSSPSVRPTVEPPTDWEEMYELVRKMRLTGPARDAAVDTMGCDRLFTADASPRDKRFHILIALMLSSQTKDTVNAVAMHRLHTELPPHAPGAPPGLNVENVLAVDPAVLNALIHQVGFHNNKTKFIKAAAVILRDSHGSDIPDTIAGLTALPGVGPKMAHLCLSAAWDRTEGIGVDVHVHRITNMWGWHRTTNPEASRLALESWLPRDRWREINTLLVGLGQTVCPPQAGAKRCGECDLGLRGLCAGADRRKVAEGRRQVEGVKAEVTEVKTETGVKAEGTDVKTEAGVKVEVTEVKEEEASPEGPATASMTVKVETRTRAGAAPRIKAEAASGSVKVETAESEQAETKAKAEAEVKIEADPAGAPAIKPDPEDDDDDEKTAVKKEV